MKSWRSLQSQYPACDEEILYSTLKTLDVCSFDSGRCG